MEKGNNLKKLLSKNVDELTKKYLPLNLVKNEMLNNQNLYLAFKSFDCYISYLENKLNLLAKDNKLLIDLIQYENKKNKTKYSSQPSSIEEAFKRVKEVNKRVDELASIYNKHNLFNEYKKDCN